MKIEYGVDRINLIPENKDDIERIKRAVPEASKAFCWFTLDAGENGLEHALVISHK